MKKRHKNFLILRIKNPEYIRSLDQDYIFFKKILIKKKIIFDIGSNQGDKAYVFSKLCKKVVLFEPNKEDYQFLIENRIYNKSIYGIIRFDFKVIMKFIVWFLKFTYH